MPDAPSSPRRPSTRRRVRARLLLLPSIFLVLGATVWPDSRESADPAPAGAPLTLFSFDRADEAAWEVVNDGVMGGRSVGFVAIEAGTLRFTGTLVTQGGGFTSVRARRDIDLSGFVGLEMRVRGSDRQFEIEVDDGLRTNGRSVSRRASFPSTAEWTVIRVPFSALRNSVFGQRVNAPSINLAQTRGVGIYMTDGQDGVFRLEVDYIRAYAESDAAF